MSFRTPDVAPLFGIPEENRLSYAQDKLKHVPQCAARKLTAGSSQRSALNQRCRKPACPRQTHLRHEIVAASKEFGG
jgi:hypothetical protein